MIPSPSTSLQRMRCASCGRRISHAGCPEHRQPNSYSIASNDRVSPDETNSTAASFPGYQVDGILGRGGFGTVYRARNADGKLVAIKESRADIPESSLRLLREAEVLSIVKPPHVPSLLEHGAFSDGTQFMVMELVGAPALADQLFEHQALSVAEVLAIVTAILQPLAAVHAHGYVHRDLKPENVLYDAKSGRAVLIDFGLSRTTYGMPTDSMDELTAEGSLVGTTDYMAPEQHDGRLDLDATADIYAVGIMLFELLTGRVPFFGPAAIVREAHRSQRPPRPSVYAPNISPGLEEIILRCLAKSPGDRFPDAAALLAAFEDLRRQVPEADADAPHSTDIPASHRSARSRSELRTVSILSFMSTLDGIALRRYLEPKGGQIVHISGGRYVVAFGNGIDANPARRAWFVARALLAEQHAQHIMLDVKQVTVRFSPKGDQRIIAPQLARLLQTPENSAPNDILLSDAARAILEATDLAEAPSPVSSPSMNEIPSGPISSPQGPTLFGRDALLDSIVSAANRTVATTTPTVVVVLAEPGYGKSQLRRALSLRLQAGVPAATIVNVQAHAPADGNAQGSLREFLLGALELPASIPEPTWIELLEARLGSATNRSEIAALALAIGWITHGDAHGRADVARALAGLEAAPGAIRTQLTAAAARALRNRARQAPLFILLDDAHFADDATIAILDRVTRGDEDAPIFVCTLGRPTFVELHRTFGTRAGIHEMHHLGPLDKTSAANFCRELLRPVENVPASAVDRIVERAQAIPLFMVELIRGIKAAGIVRKSPLGGGHYLATDELDRLSELPLIEWLVHRELDGLPEGVRAHAQLAAVLGVEVTNTELEGVLERLDRAGLGGEFPLDARIGSERLVACGLFERAGRNRYRFRHALLREAIVRTVADDLRPSVHRAAVDHWQSVDSPGDLTAMAKLAHHAAHTGDKKLAANASLALAESACVRHDYLEAERWYTEAFEHAAHLGADSIRRRLMLRGRALMRYRLGRYSDARVDLAAARNAAMVAADKLAEADILLDEATVLDWMGEHSLSAQCVDQAFDQVSLQDAPPLLEARLLLGRGRSLHRASREKEARAELERVLAVAEPLGEEAYETRVIALLMSSFILQGLARLEDAARALDQAVAACEAHGDLLHLASAVNNRALLMGCLGDKASMVNDFDRVIALGRHLGQDAIQIAGHYNLGEYLYLWDEVEAAMPHAECALQLEMSRTANSPRMEIELLPARIMLYRGDLAAARERVSLIRAQERAAAPAPAVDVLCTMVAYASNGVHEAAWEALEERSAQFSIGQERIEVIEARAIAALRRGEVDEAKRHFLRALDAARAIPNVMQGRLEQRMRAIAVS